MIAPPPPMALAQPRPADRSPRLGGWVRLFAWATLALAAAMPAAISFYLYSFQNPALKYENHSFHVVAIVIACSLSGFVSFVAWRCWMLSGEAFLRFTALALLGFTVVYLPHGLLTPLADHHLWLFLLYGPFSRVVMGAYMLTALCRYSERPEAAENPLRAHPWRVHFWVIGGVAAIVPFIAEGPLAASFLLRLTLEGLAALLCGAALVVMVSRDIRSPLMTLTGMALILFAESSLTFLFAKPWNHLWWFAHVIFAGGFFVLSFGVAQAYRYSGSFASVFSHDQIVSRIAGLRASEEAAKVGEERLRDILNTSPTGIAVTTAHGRVLFRNRRLEEMFHENWDQCAMLLQHAIAVSLNQPAAEEPGGEIPFRRRQGQTGWAIVTAMPIQYQGEAAAVLHVQDVTARKEAEQRLMRAVENGRPDLV